jgi:hypothetical protein
MPIEANTHFIIVCQDDEGHEHPIRVSRSESNARVMGLHACLVQHGFSPGSSNRSSGARKPVKPIDPLESDVAVKRLRQLGVGLRQGWRAEAARALRSSNASLSALIAFLAVL